MAVAPFTSSKKRAEITNQARYKAGCLEREREQPTSVYTTGRNDA